MLRKTIGFVAMLVLTVAWLTDSSDSSIRLSFVPLQPSRKLWSNRIVDTTRRRSSSFSNVRRGDATSHNESISLSNTVVVSPRKRQVRRKPRDRRPKNYWSDSANVEKELRLFWKNLNVSSIHGNDDFPPTIPNESLLNHFERHDLRAAIAMQGGRKVLSLILGQAPIMPGKWKEAVETSPQLKQLLDEEKHGLTPDRPPLSPQQKKAKKALLKGGKGKKERSSKAKRPKGYWNMRLVIEGLYDYLDDCQANMQRPATWMPRLSELEANGRQDLKLAITRFGGAKKICLIGRLVPYREWHYFEGQLELFVELKQYLDKYHEGNQESFPSVTDMKENGHVQLYRLVQQYGGRKFVAGRLSMKHTEKQQQSMFTATYHYHDLDWGTFSLDFGIRLLFFIRDNQMTLRPPLKYPAIFMPSQSQLIAKGPFGVQLDKEINEYGGYENVGRRLGLAIRLDPRFRSM